MEINIYHNNMFCRTDLKYNTQVKPYYDISKMLK